MGLTWLTGWIGLLWVVVSPWSWLGGIVDELSRWLVWFVLVMGLAIGGTIGGCARDAAAPGTGRTHLGLIRYTLLPAASLTATAMVILTALERPDATLVAVTAFAAYWAGVDLVFAALPLLGGRPHPWHQALVPGDPRAAGYSADPDDAEQAAGWLAPWDRG